MDGWGIREGRIDVWMTVEEVKEEEGGGGGEQIKIIVSKCGRSNID